jgi:hypothetical protein
MKIYIGIAFCRSGKRGVQELVSSGLHNSQTRAGQLWVILTKAHSAEFLIFSVSMAEIRTIAVMGATGKQITVIMISMA